MYVGLVKKVIKQDDQHITTYNTVHFYNLASLSAYMYTQLSNVQFKISVVSRDLVTIVFYFFHD